MAKKDSTLESILAVVGLATAADFILVGDMPPLFKSLLNGDTSILSRPADWFGFIKVITEGGTPALTAPTGGGTAGDSFVGTHIYKPTGKKCSCSAGKPQTIGCSGKSVTSVRSNCDGCALYNVEATGMLQFAGACGCGDEATIKHLGPNHQDGNCCWHIATISQSGKVGFNNEGPHPETTSPKPETAIGNVGSVANKKIGFKSIIWNQGGKWHHEVWIDVTGSGSNWKKAAQMDFTEWGNVKKSSTPASNQQIEFRCDCNDAKWLATEVVEIVPGATATGAEAAPAPLTPNSTAPTPELNEVLDPNAGTDKKKEKAKAKFVGGARYATYFSPPIPEPTRYYNGRLVYR